LLYSAFAGTPDVVPRLRNGESWMSVEVPPLFVTCQNFCEYCAVAKARLAMTPRQVATPRRFAVRGEVSARGSMLLGCDTEN
jgi:wyosine [tRNA(Phe)-imidazoG37] synthetase (radical SAM superfamily)